MYRYYRGTAPWMTLPPIGAHAFHRYDLIKERMAASDQAEPLRPLIDAAGRTLAGGGRVFVVGRLDPLPPESVTVLPPSPHPGPRWPEAAHRKQWSSMLRAFLQSHADSLKRVPLQNASAIRAYEDLHLFVAAGWRP